MSQAEYIDKVLIQGYLDNLGGAVVSQMLDLYEQQSQVYLEDIQGAHRAKSQQEWQERCHKMKGAAGSVGLLQVHSQLVAIEKSTDDWTKKSEYITRLISLNNDALTEFRNWLNSL
ncbi:phosphorelay protein [Thalassotalea sp. M1531]|uniref:Phosphorelay protein n=1 Tax=Thalassotalea algicola TaxID=2716224 RepID=A0A7Y0L9V6_9GAMM|nr:Hpt domain-containing protein [Thalassotalea algicola]NMP30329.1 phosphorelay protein [Thalassotalea algicola]